MCATQLIQENMFHIFIGIVVIAVIGFLLHKKILFHIHY